MDSDAEVEKDEVLGPNESETAINERDHNKLLDAISSLDGNKRHKLTQRTVFSNQISEFNFATSKDAFSKVALHELVGSLKESASHGTLKKQLNSVKKKRQLVDIPLPKHEKQKIDRSTAYESTTVDLSKWDPVVQNNRQADQLQFPLQKSDVKLVSSQQFVSRFQPRTPLEMQVAALLQGSDHVFKSKQQELTPAEQRALRAMDLQEARERRNELCKHRALLSYKEAKAKRTKKIKSKKYHRILKRERLRKEVKDLEEMKTRDPEGYTEKMGELEKARIQERLTLKHRGGSKFARRQMIYSKYNDKARDQVQEMLQMSREITKKVDVESDPEDLVSEDDDGAQVTTESRTYKGDNPWMARPPAVSAKSRAAAQSGEQEKESDDDVEEDKDDTCDNDGVNMADSGIIDETMSDEEQVSEEIVTDDTAPVVNTDDINLIFSKAGKKKNKKKKDETVKIEKLNTKKQKDKRGKKRKAKEVNVEEESVHQDLDKANEDDDEIVDDEGVISEGLSRKRTLDDIEDMLQTEEPVETTLVKKAKTKKDKAEVKKAKKSTEVSVDPKKLFTLETRIQHAGSQPEIIDEDADGDMDAEEQHRMTIAQAFADDDVIDEFAAEKKESEDRDTPKDVDLFLPGWGSWGGTGLAPPKKKKKRFTIKAPLAAPRKDMGLGHVIINENKSEAIKKHQVSDIPFPYMNAAQFESSIRAPVGRTWNPETAFQQLTMPKVKTQTGAIIAPMDKAEVFKNQKPKTEESSDNQSGKSRTEQNRTAGKQSKFSRSKTQNKKHKQKGQGKMGKVAKKK